MATKEKVAPSIWMLVSVMFFYLLAREMGPNKWRTWPPQRLSEINVFCLFVCLFVLCEMGKSGCVFVLVFPIYLSCNVKMYVMQLELFSVCSGSSLLIDHHPAFTRSVTRDREREKPSSTVGIQGNVLKTSKMKIKILSLYLSLTHWLLCCWSKPLAAQSSSIWMAGSELSEPLRKGRPKGTPSALVSSHWLNWTSNVGASWTPTRCDNLWEIWNKKWSPWETSATIDPPSFFFEFFTNDFWESFHNPVNNRIPRNEIKTTHVVWLETGYWGIATQIRFTYVHTHTHTNRNILHVT